MRLAKGFTLIEMLVVLVIIGLLAGLVGPRLFGQADSSRIKAAEVQVKMLRGALLTLQLDFGRFPANEEGLRLLVKPPADSAQAARWKGPYLDEPSVPLDPWSNPYQYSVSNNAAQPFYLYSLGADGQPGGEGNAADIGYTPER
ncbi:MAG: type II secretion system major pseudopilin GspG [Gammaproteobacteria bacterium]|nr:type II secretion system major pseudopilin GspG [Gammaproteobacteria bacterium]